MRKRTSYEFTHDQMTDIASALRDGFDGKAKVDWAGWNQIVCDVEEIDGPIIVDRKDGFHFPDGFPLELMAGIRLDVQAICAA